MQSEAVITSSKASGPDHPVIFRRGEMANAEPAKPGWRMTVEAWFE